MAAQETHATPPANSGGSDLAASLTALTGVVTQLAESQKTVVGLVEKMATASPAVATPTPTPAAAGTAKPLTAEDVSKIVRDAMAGQQQTTQAEASKRAFVADKLKDLPAAYQRQLGDDASKWAAEEQQIRQQYRADFKIAGGTTPNVGGTTAGGTPAAQTVDTSKLSPTQLIEQGLKESKPADGVVKTRTQPVVTRGD